MSEQTCDVATALSKCLQYIEQQPGTVPAHILNLKSLAANANAYRLENFEMELAACSLVNALDACDAVMFPNKEQEVRVQTAYATLKASLLLRTDLATV